MNTASRSDHLSKQKKLQTDIDRLELDKKEDAKRYEAKIKEQGEEIDRLKECLRALMQARNDEHLDMPK